MLSLGVVFLQVTPDQSQEVGGRFVTRRQTAIEGLQVAPADRSFDVLGRFPLLEQASQGLAIQGVSRLKFTDGQLRLGHEILSTTT